MGDVWKPRLLQINGNQIQFKDLQTKKISDKFTLGSGSNVEMHKGFITVTGLKWFGFCTSKRDFKWQDSNSKSLERLAEIFRIPIDKAKVSENATNPRARLKNHKCYKCDGKGEIEDGSWFFKPRCPTCNGHKILDPNGEPYDSRDRSELVFALFDGLYGSDGVQLDGHIYAVGSSECNCKRGGSCRSARRRACTLTNKCKVFRRRLPSRAFPPFKKLH